MHLRRFLRPQPVQGRAMWRVGESSDCRSAPVLAMTRTGGAAADARALGAHQLLYLCARTRVRALVAPAVLGAAVVASCASADQLRVQFGTPTCAGGGFDITSGSAPLSASDSCTSDDIRQPGNVLFHTQTGAASAYATAGRLVVELADSNFTIPEPGFGVQAEYFVRASFESQYTITGPAGVLSMTVPVRLRATGLANPAAPGDAKSGGQVGQRVAFTFNTGSAFASVFSPGFVENDTIGIGPITSVNGGSVEFTALVGVNLNIPQTLRMNVSATSRARATGSNSNAVAVELGFSRTQPVFDLPEGFTITGPGLVNNRFFDVTGDLEVIGTGGEVIDAPFVESVAGDVVIRNNVASKVVDLGDVTTVVGDVSVADNPLTTIVDLGDLTAVGGHLSVGDNPLTTIVDLGDLTTVAGDLSVVDNAPTTIVDLGDLLVTGSLVIDASGTSVDYSGVSVGGDSLLTLTDVSEFLGMTAGGSTSTGFINDAVSFRVILPDGSVESPVLYSVNQLTGAELDPRAQGDGSRIDPLAGYQLQFDTHSLDEPAQLIFDIALGLLPDPQRLDLLDAIASNTFTLAVRGDAPGSEYLAFALAPFGAEPILDTTVRLSRFDDLGMLLGVNDAAIPTRLRFDALVSHFSSYSIGRFVAANDGGGGIGVPAPGGGLLPAMGLVGLLLLRRRGLVLARHRLHGGISLR